MIASRVPIIPTFIEAVDITIPLGQDEWVTLQRQSSSRSALSGLLSPFRMEVVETFVFQPCDALINTSFKLQGLALGCPFRVGHDPRHVRHLPDVPQIPAG